jgi:hypothetical protein
MLYTNRPKETVRSAFYLLTAKPCAVTLCCPFFSNGNLIKEVHERGCTTRLVVRLCSATNPAALRQALELGTQVRFFNSARFHSKLYIFGDDVALVGSANLTDSGVQSNQEILVGLTPEDHRFEDLVQLAQSYWNEAEPLDGQRLEEYAYLFDHNRTPTDPLESKLRAAFGDIAPAGIQVGIPRKTKDAIYLAEYRRTYQEFLHAFRVLEKLYRLDGRRQQHENIVPLRLEIDMFLSYVRIRHVPGESYLEQKFLNGAELEDKIKSHINLWHDIRWSHLDNVIPDNYSLITRTLGTQTAIQAASFDQIVEALEVCHAFHELLRFFRGGLPSVRRAFMSDNTEGKVKSTLSYLLFGSSDFISRMGECIFDPSYQLRHFGRSCVQELFGWLNKEAPVCNGRTVKSLRYLGFNVVVFR